MGQINSLINQYQLNYSSDPLAKYKQLNPYQAGQFDIWLKNLRQKLWAVVRLEKSVYLLEIIIIKKEIKLYNFNSMVAIATTLIKKGLQFQ